jgi:hypothetical protein
VAAIAEPTPKAAAMSVQTISAYAFEVRIRFIVMVFLLCVVGLLFGCSGRVHLSSSKSNISEISGHVTQLKP